MLAEEEIKKTIFKHIPPNEYEVFLFGSRAMGANRKWSDYDVGLLGKNKVPYKIMNKIETELEESDIPYKVDIVDFNRVSDKFREMAMKKRKLWIRN